MTWQYWSRRYGLCRRDPGSENNGQNVEVALFGKESNSELCGMLPIGNYHRRAAAKELLEKFPPNQPVSPMTKATA